VFLSSAQVTASLLLSCRYLLKCESAELSVPEVDAVLAMTTSDVLFDVQTMQDMQVSVHMLTQYFLLMYLLSVDIFTIC